MGYGKKSVLVLAFVCAIVVAIAGPAAAEDKDVVEKPIAWDQLPAAVQKTIRAEAGDHAIAEIEEIHQKDQVYYEADWIEGENEIEIRVAIDGKLIGREVEKAEAEDDSGAAADDPEEDDGGD
jgi:hypothetical protein